MTIDTVPIGNPGNPADMEIMTTDGTSGYGSVPYPFWIGKYEVTAGQYTEFLNAVADTDTYGLYNTAMSDPAFDPSGANIQRTGGLGSYSYSVAPEWANRPVNYVSYWDAMRFANWLHNGQPGTGLQNDLTTEDGAYDLDGYNGSDGTWIIRKPNAKFWIPSENEWYKAAYHKNDGATGNYWDYPTASDTTPINSLPDPGNHANFYDLYHTGNGSFSFGAPYYRTEVGAFENSPSPYGTFDQGGNVLEWNETVIAESYRYIGRGERGGWWLYYSNYLSASLRSNGAYPNFEGYYLGFRVATAIPEPSSLVVTAFGLLALLLPSRRRPR